MKTKRLYVHAYAHVTLAEDIRFARLAAIHY